MRAGAVWAAVALAAVAVGCRTGPRLEDMRRADPPGPALRFGQDTFAFANESRSKNRGKPDLYANWCFVMVRAVRQFHQFARFDPTGPRLGPAEYTARVRRITARPPWEAPLAPDDRTVIPGYASLYEFSSRETAAVKAGLSGRFWTWIHWTNWRVAFPVTRAQQERVARETLTELQAGRPVQWLVTNLPTIELNHTVLAYDYRVVEGGAVEFVVYDPNDPSTPGLVRFDAAERRFWATRLFDTRVGPIRVFRMYVNPLL